MFIGQHGMKLKDKAEKGGGCADQGSSFRLGKLRFQMFDGNVRKYPRFKSELISMLSQFASLAKLHLF